MKDLSEILNNIDPDTDVEDIDKVGFDKQIALAKIIRFNNDSNDRVWLAKWTAGVTTGWLFFVLLILAFNNSRLCLSDTVLVTLLTTTTINVLGLVLIVLHGHFKNI